MTLKPTDAKFWLFASSGLVVFFGVVAMATLGAVAKVPAAEYWTVVLGAIFVGGAWLGLITLLHLTSKSE